MWKWINQHATRVGQRKTLSPRQIRTYDLRNTGRALYPLELRRTHGKRGYILGSYLTRVVHTAGISNVAVVLCGERIKDGKFYARWNKCEIELISIPRAWDKEKQKKREEYIIQAAVYLVKNVDWYVPSFKK